MAKRKAFLLRLDPRLFDAVQRWSDDEFRSVNGQIEYLLRDALRRAGRLPKPPRRGADAPNAGSAVADSAKAESSDDGTD